MEFRILTSKDKEEAVALAVQLEPDTYTVEMLNPLFDEMFAHDGHRAFGVFEEGTMVGWSTGWLSTRFYCGRQLELDNVVTDANRRSQGIGKFLVEKILEWCVENKLDAVELNAYIPNKRAHSFYENLGFNPVGIHFQKKL
ncbi:MAG: hypothetical protein SchgKO_14020 [Schleiferiaceae bacterium]